MRKSGFEGLKTCRSFQIATQEDYFFKNKLIFGEIIGEIVKSLRKARQTASNPKFFR